MGAVQIHPTRACGDLTWAGLATVGIGLLLASPATVAYGGALLVGVAIARTVTEVGVARIRAAGFEMLWSEPERTRRVASGDTFHLRAEIRNRDTRAARYGGLRVVASPDLEVSVSPEEAEVPAAGRLRVDVTVRAPRVGRHGIHGLSLEVRGSPGLFEVPLTFANPYVVEVFPAPFAPAMRSARGGRSRMSAPDGKPGLLAGDGSEFRELREHRPGDAFKHIAWKASARRGRLLIIENELEERDVVWVLLDASVENWFGAPGRAPLDLAVDAAAAVIERHLARGDRVGLAVVGARVLKWLPPDRGATHAANLMGALAFDAACNDADRSDWDEADVAERVLEHMRPLDPGSASNVRSSDIERIARRAERVRRKAPTSPVRPQAASSREQSLRHYLASFGIQSPPRNEAERPHTELRLARLLQQLGREKKRPSILYIWGRPPDFESRGDLLAAIERFPKKRTELRWCSLSHVEALPSDDDPASDLVRDALRLRLEHARRRGERELSRRGARPMSPQRRGPIRRPA